MYASTLDKLTAILDCFNAYLSICLDKLCLNMFKSFTEHVRNGAKKGLVTENGGDALEWVGVKEARTRMVQHSKVSFL